MSELKKNSNTKIYIFALIVFMVSMAYCLSIGSNKQISFCDEVYTYESANLPGKSNPFHSINTWITGKDIQWYLSAEGHNPHFGEINKYLWEDHVPLYFWCIRVMSILFYDSCSPMIGICVNALIFSLFSFWLSIRMYQLFERWLSTDGDMQTPLRKNSWIVMCMILMLFLWMQGTVFQVVFSIRPYILLLCFGIMLLYEYMLFFFEPYENTIEDKKRMVWRTIRLTLLAVGGLLSHYHFWILLFVCGVMTWLTCVWKKQWNKVVLLILHAICAIGIATCLFPQWLHNLFVYKGSDAKAGLIIIENWIPGIIKALKQLTVNVYPFDDISWYLSWMIIIIIFYCAFSIMKERKHYKYIKVLVFLSMEVLLYTIIVSISSTYLDESRYFWVPQAMFALLLYTIAGYAVVNGKVLLNQIKESQFFYAPSNCLWLKVKIYLIGGLLLLTVICSGMKTFSKENMDSLKGTRNEEFMESIADIPWIVYTEGFHWVGYCSAYDLMHAKDICFVLNFPEFMDYNLYLPNDKEIILFTENVFCEDAIIYFEKLTQKEVTCKQIGNSMYLNVYHLKFALSEEK